MSQLLSRLRAGLQAPQVRRARPSYPVPLRHTNHRPALRPQLRAWSLGSYGIAAPCALLMRRLSTASPPASTQPGVGANPPLVRLPPCVDAGRGLEVCPQPPTCTPALGSLWRGGEKSRWSTSAAPSSCTMGRSRRRSRCRRRWWGTSLASSPSRAPSRGAAAARSKRRATLAPPQLATPGLLGPACGVRLYARMCVRPIRGSGLRCALGWAGGLGG